MIQSLANLQAISRKASDPQFFTGVTDEWRCIQTSQECCGGVIRAQETGTPGANGAANCRKAGRFAARKNPKRTWHWSNRDCCGLSLQAPPSKIPAIWENTSWFTFKTKLCAVPNVKKSLFAVEPRSNHMQQRRSGEQGVESFYALDEKSGWEVKYSLLTRNVVRHDADGLPACLQPPSYKSPQQQSPIDGGGLESTTHDWTGLSIYRRSISVLNLFFKTADTPKGTKSGYKLRSKLGKVALVLQESRAPSKSTMSQINVD